VTRRTGKLAIAAGAAVAGAALVAACASSTPKDAPDWYLAHLNSPGANQYPRLQDVPHGASDANVDQAHWSAEEAELLAAAKAMKANPRATPAGGAEDPAAFDAAARAAIEATRASH
jgi:hypothetical protein